VLSQGVRHQKKTGRRTRIVAMWYWIAGAVALVGIVVARVPPHRSAANTEFPFPCLAHETLALHIHPYLRIMIEGQPMEVPTAIGIRNPRFDQGLAVGGSCFEPLHTHDTSGIIHIEGPDPNHQYTLGDFFAVWHATYPTIEIGGRTYPVDFAAGEILGHKADAAHHVRLLVDGKPSSRGPALVLNGLDYCSAQSTSPPCLPTAVGDPSPPRVLEQYGTGHTIVIEFQ
jgi:hypothetical protein